MFQLLFRIFSGRKRHSLENKNFKIIFLFLVLFWYSAAGFLYFELPAKPDLNWFDAMWWSIVTMATVGYGDLFPMSLGGRFFVGVPTIIIGIGLLTVIVSQLAVKLIESQSRRARGMANITMKGHILIINYSHYDEVLNLVTELRSDPSTKDCGICLIDDSITELPHKLLDHNVEFVKGNPSSEAVLTQANLTKASRVIVLSKDRSNAHSDDRNLAIIVMIEKLAPEIFSLAEIIDPHKTKVFELAGCNSVMCLSGVSSNFIIKELLDPGTKDIFDELLSNKDGKELYFIPVKVRDGLTFKQLVLWGLEHASSVMGIVRGGKNLLSCSPAELLQEGDRAIVIADDRVEIIDTDI